MYHKTRFLHRWAGLIASLFLVLIAGTGFLLAMKHRFDWMRSPDQRGGAVADMSEVISMDAALQAAFAMGMPELRDVDDVDRVDYRPGRNVFKIHSREGYKEVQVDGLNGDVLSVSFRGDQLTEDLHDLTFFAEWMHAYWLPIVAVLLFVLGLTGTIIFFVPVIRRYRFRHRRE